MVEQKNEKKRIKYLSVARGIGILLVVIGHCTPLAINKYIYLFHMPMFFLISGFLGDLFEVKNVKNYVYKKIKKLYVPYVMVNVFFLLCRSFFYEIGFYQDGYLSVERINSIGEFFKDLGSIFLLVHMELISAPTWFIRVLFVASVVCVIAYKLLKSSFAIQILSGLSFIGVYLMLAFNIHLNSVLLYGCLVLLAVFFMMLGYLMRKIENKISYSIVLVLLAIVMLFVLGQFGTIQMVKLEIMNPFFFLATTILGTYAVFGLSKMLCESKLGDFFGYIGDHTMIILCLHVFSFKIVNLLYSAKTGDFDCLKKVYNSPNCWWMILNILAGIGVPLLIEFLYRKVKNVFVSRRMKGAIN